MTNKDPGTPSARERLAQLKARGQKSRHEIKIAATELSNQALNEADKAKAAKKAKREAEERELKAARAHAAQMEAFSRRAIKDVTDVKNLEARTRQSLRGAEAEVERLRKELAQFLPPTIRMMSQRQLWGSVVLLLLLSNLAWLVGSILPAPSNSLIIRSELIEEDLLLIVYRLPDGSDIDRKHFYIGHVEHLKGCAVKALRLRIEQGKDRKDLTVDIQTPPEYDMRRLYIRLRNAARE